MVFRDSSIIRNSSHSHTHVVTGQSQGLVNLRPKALFERPHQASEPRHRPDRYLPH